MLKRIRYTKLIDNKAVLSQVDNDDVVKDCFQFCTPAIKRRVKDFIDSGKQLTVDFGNHKVRLEKL